MALPVFTQNNNVMQVQSLKQYIDKNTHRLVFPGEVLEVNEERAAELIGKKCVMPWDADDLDLGDYEKDELNNDVAEKNKSPLTAKDSKNVHVEKQTGSRFQSGKRTFGRPGKSRR